MTQEPHPPSEEHKGIIPWFARNRVAANLLMLILLVGGLLMMPGVQREVFPQVDLDMIIVEAIYPGASPEEVEQGVIFAVEEAIRGVENVKRILAVADEGRAVVSAELELGADADQALNDIESAVGRITSFPADVEQPIVRIATNRVQVISLIIYGDVEEATLRDLAERARDELLYDERVSFVELGGVRPLEISVEVPRDELRRYGLTLPDIARRIDESSIDLAAGDIETSGGEIVLRTTEREETADAVARIIVISGPGTGTVRLGDIAEVSEGFEDIDQAAFYNGLPAVRVNVFRMGDQTPVGVSEAAREYAETLRSQVPETVNVALWNDISEIYADRMGLLRKNGLLGLVLVLLLLGLFLEPRLAFWVTLGIPVSFLGAMLFLPTVDISLNIISLFAFIITLGLVVDDAIVVGEAVFRRRREEGERPLVATAVDGAREVARPVIFAIATTCIAFAPMLFVPGVAGKFFRNIPIVVILVLLLSLVESLLVLPAHLSHPMPRLLELLLRPFFWLMSLLRSDAVSRGLDWFVERVYVPLARRLLEWRYLTIACAVALLALVAGLPLGGHLGFSFLPRIQDDEVAATLRMPVGTPEQQTEQLITELVESSYAAATRLGDADMIEGVWADLGIVQPRDMGGAMAIDTGSHLASVQVDLVPAGKRSVSSREFSDAWREEMGRVPGAETLIYSYTTGATGGAPINVRLSHPDTETLRAAAEELAAAMDAYAGVRDVDDGFSAGKERLDFNLTEEARARGLTDANLAQQLRASFFGAEAQRFQRGRNEVRVYVRLSEEERQSLDVIDELVIQTPAGGEMPLSAAANIERSSAFTVIERTDLRRTVNVTADIEEGVANANEVMDELRAGVLRDLEERYPQLRHSPGGEQEEQAEALGSLARGFAIALIVMFAVIAIAFQSYVQPVIVLIAIPFGAIGAVLGHLLLGFDLSLSSMFGLLALSGVVVNTSLLLVVAINDEREKQDDLGAAVLAGAERRFRPIVLTSLTTFFGLAPMIFETSVQAQFLIPMALSLGFGVLFATLILVFFVPALYLVIEDIRHLLQRRR